MSLKKNLGEKYSPLYFLASLGNGGLVVTFFMFLQCMVPHKGMPLITFDLLRPYLSGDRPLVAAAIVLAMLGIIFFSYRHFRMLIWNLNEYRQFRTTPAFMALKQSSAGVSISAVPLTLAMSVNVVFMLGAVFVPGLWDVVEYLFPFALAAFVAIGIYALRVFLPFFSSMLATGSFDGATNRSLSQMLAVFSFAMVGVGMAAPAAMSTTLITSVLGIIGSLFFFSATVLLGLMGLFLGFRAMLEHGVDRMSSASLWVVIPILTLLGIVAVRLSHGLHNSLEVHSEPGELFVLLISFFSAQVLFGLLGYLVMKKVNYFDEFVWGDGRSVGSYALICPGVALFVFGMFVLHPGLVDVGVLTMFSVPYFILIAFLVVLQAQTIRVLFRLDRKLLHP